jgi:hypothetical protein
MKISTFVGDLNLIYVVERDIFYKTVSQFLDNLFLSGNLWFLKEQRGNKILASNR